MIVMGAPYQSPIACVAKIVAAEGEYQAAVKLGQAADIVTQHPVALQLRTLQAMAEISVEKNSTIIFAAKFMTTVRDAIALLGKASAGKWGADVCGRKHVKIRIWRFDSDSIGTEALEFAEEVNVGRIEKLPVPRVTRYLK
jgi:hypothetical protein